MAMTEAWLVQRDAGPGLGVGWPSAGDVALAGRTTYTLRENLSLALAGKVHFCGLLGAPVTLKASASEVAFEDGLGDPAPES